MTQTSSNAIATPVILGTIAATFLALAPQGAAAQDPNTVTLRFAGDQESLSGPLIKFEDDKFLIDSKIGMVAIPASAAVCIGDACPEGTRLVLEESGVTLTSLDGTVMINGDLIEVDGDEYVLATAFGEQRIQTAMVTCEGVGCVEVTAARLDADSTEVILSDGEVTLTGELIGTDDGFYIIDEAVMGELRVSAAKFTCVGPKCPAL